MIWPNDAALERARRGDDVPMDVVLEPLRGAQRVLGVAPGRTWKPELMDRQKFFLYILPLAYTTALLVDVLPMVWPRLLLGKTERRGIACGFQSGDGVTLGWITPRGWAR